MAVFSITNYNKFLYTLNPDGTVYKTLSSGNYGKNRIGEYKKIVMYFDVGGGETLDGKMIFISPALFGDPNLRVWGSGQIPNEGWSYQVPSTAVAGTFQMGLNVNVPYASDLIKNWNAEIEIVSATVFYVTFWYYQVYDMKGYINSANENNHSKLLKDQYANPNELTVFSQSVYNNVNWIPIFYVLAYDPSNVATYGSTYVYYSGYKAGFYNKNEHQTTPFFNNPTWTLYDTTPSAVTGLSLQYNTKVKFTVDTSGSTIDKVLLWLIKTGTTGNTVDFKDNYDASFCEVTTLGSGTLDNKLVAPSQDITLVSGSTYDCFAHVDLTQLAAGETYRFIAVVYLEEYGNLYVNSFISDEYAVGLPQFDGTGYAFEAKLTDYLNDYTGNDLTCVVEERIKSTITLDYSYNTFKNDIFNRLGLTLTNNDIRRYLTKITCEIFEDLGATVHYLKRDIAYKTSPTTYTTPTGLSLDFTGEVLTIEWDWRNRYESAIANVETTISNVIVAPSSNQDWGGRTLQIRFKLELYYDDYSTPFSDTIHYLQQINVKDYCLPTILKINQENGQAVASYYCNDADPEFEAENFLTAPETYKLITTAELDPGNIASIEENETFTGELTQLTSTKFSAQEEDYSETETTKAKFSLDVNNFFVNLPYKISAMAKYAIPVNARITEDGILRDLETTSFRIIE